MSNLKSLTFVQAPSTSLKTPADFRRHRLVERLEEQRMLAKDPTFVPISKRWIKKEDGSKALVVLISTEN